MTFIRAPYINNVLSPDGEVLAEVDGHIVAARQVGNSSLHFIPNWIMTREYTSFFFQWDRNTIIM